MDWQEKFDKTQAFVKEAEKSLEINETDLANVLYTISEFGLWPDDVDSVSPEMAKRIWSVVEKVSKEGFPKELNM